MLKKLIIGTITFSIIYIMSTNWHLLNTLNNLANINLEGININGKEFTLHKGKIYEDGKELFWFLPHQRKKTSQVIGLSGFYMWNKEDPLLTSPDFNAEEFERSIKLLEEQDKRFQEDMNLRYSIFPVKFLHSLSQVKKSTDRFLQRPSLENAENLLQKQYQTVEFYQEDIEQRLRLLEENINENNENANIMYLGVATTPQIVVNDYKTLLDNAKEIRSQVDKRGQCLEGKGSCVRPSKDFPKMKTSKTTANNAKIMNDDILFGNTNDSTVKRTGPFVVPTSCLGLNENVKEQKQIYYLLQDTLDRHPIMKGYEILRAAVATEKYFRRVGEVLTEDRFTSQLGLSWTIQVTTQTYNCPDLTYLAKLSTMNSYVAKLHKQPLFRNVSLTGKDNIDKIIGRGKDVENQLITSEIKDFDTFGELTNLYLQFYYQVYSDPELSNLQKQADVFLEHGLGMQRLLDDIHLTLNRMTSEFIFLSLHEALDNIEAGNLYLYGIRNIPSLIYLTFSKSVFRLDDKPQYYQPKLVDNIGFDKPYLTYTLALTRYPKEEILAWHHNPDKVLLDVYNTYLDFKRTKKNL